MVCINVPVLHPPDSVAFSAITGPSQPTDDITSTAITVIGTERQTALPPQNAKFLDVNQKTRDTGTVTQVHVKPSLLHGAAKSDPMMVKTSADGELLSQSVLFVISNVTQFTNSRVVERHSVGCPTEFGSKKLCPFVTWDTTASGPLQVRWVVMNAKTI